MNQHIKYIYTKSSNAPHIQERLAIFLSGRLEAEKISPNPRRRAIRRTPHNTQHSNNNPNSGRNQQQASVNGGY